MKTKFAIAALALVVTSSTAFAVGTQGVAGGQIDFVGKVNPVSCTISVDGKASDSNVYLAPISKSEFKKEGSAYKVKSFYIDLANCTGNNTGNDKATVALKWSATNLSNATKGYLANVEESRPNGANGVSLVLLSKNDKQIVPNVRPSDHALAANIVGENYRFEYKVGYVATNKIASVSSGDVHGYAIYEVEYK